MSARELVEHVFAGEKPPRVPVYGVITSDVLMEYFGGETLTPRNSEEIAVRTYREMVDFCRPTDNFLGPNWKPGSQTDALGYVWLHERWTKWVEKIPYNSTEEMAKILKKEIEMFRAWQPPDITGLKLEHDASAPPFAAQEEELERLQVALGDDVLMAGRACIGNSHGPVFRDGLEWWSYLQADYPQVITEWAEARHNANLLKIQAMVKPEACPVEFIDTDLAYKTGLLYSPDFLRQCGWFRRLAELVDCFHSRGVKVIFHSDGNILSILKDLEATGIDGLNPIETASGLTVGAVRRQCPDLVIVGGLDNHILTFGTMEQTREATLKCLQEGGRRMIIGTSTEEFDGVMRKENVLAALDTVWEYKA